MAAELDHDGEPGRRPDFDVVGMAASAGGLAAISQVLSRLPEDFPAAIVLVQHLDPRHASVLAEILGRRTTLLVRQACEGDYLQPRTALVAPPDHHLVVGEGGVITLTQTGLVHFVRPSADLMLESLATVYGERVIAVVLSGSGSDGAAGVTAVKRRGGHVIAQDEATSAFFSMPQAAVATGCVDLTLAVEEIAEALVTLVTKGAVG
jgi:two-component system chemotaxis response regulator CheB